MFKTVLSLAALGLAVGVFAVPRPAHADDLLIKRLQQEQAMQLPARGMTMAQVQHKYGAPTRKLQARGGDSARHPLIKRWEYDNYIVYFEHDHVIHSVLNTPAGNNRHPAQAN